VAEIALVSGCLLGIPCRYDGRYSTLRLEDETIGKLDLTVIPVCPEQLGGLPTPRSPAEIQGGDGFDVIMGRARVVTRDGQDVTEQYIRGAQQVVRIAQITGATMMITKMKSPSCSASGIYNGTFSRTLIKGMGVTAALLRLESEVLLKDLDSLSESALARASSGGLPDCQPCAQKRDVLSGAMTTLLSIYQHDSNWDDRLQSGVDAVARELPTEGSERVCEAEVQEAFRCALPGVCTGVSDSDTVRFFREVFRRALGVEIVGSDRHCRICTYPEGFLDTYLDHEGICSACRMYLDNKVLIEDKGPLRASLRGKLDEMSSSARYDGVLAFSGGKDSVYMLTRLARDYHARLLCVMDDLNQQTAQAMDNARRAARAVRADFRLLSPPRCERNVRKNFMRAGESFCRLCLRSHLVRLYQVALEQRIPFVFFGLSPYQCLDCPDSIQWSLNAIEDVSTPHAHIDFKNLVERYRHRAFQGGFERGFVTPQERRLLRLWMNAYDRASSDFAPLVIPFFLFDGYPDEAQIMDTITREVGWERPETFLLRRTNCRWLRPAGIVHRAIGRYHLNYKERAAALRFQGTYLSEEGASSSFLMLNSALPEEAMTITEFEAFLHHEIGLQFTELPRDLQANLVRLLRSVQVPSL